MANPWTRTLRGADKDAYIAIPHVQVAPSFSAGCHTGVGSSIESEGSEECKEGGELLRRGVQ